jgi:UPF0716 family protein affecting phage T7 exclusion
MKNKILFLLKIITAIILLQTLFFKFSGSAESVYIFSRLGIEPYGRIGSGIAELIAAILLLWPSTTVFGALISLGIISGALVSHLTVLGISVMDDHGLLFYLAVIVFCSSLGILLLKKEELLHRIRRFLGRKKSE